MKLREKILFAIAFMAIGCLGFGLIGMTLWPAQSDATRSTYLLALVVGMFSLGLSLRELPERRNNYYHRRTTACLLAAFAAAMVWALTKEPELANALAGGAMLFLLALAGVFFILGAGRPPIGTILPGGREVIGYSLKGDMITRLADISTAEHLRKRGLS
jgi:hypothetical protein